MSVLAILWLVASAALSGQERPLPAFEPFVREVKARLRTDADLQAGWTYTERRREQTLDGSGRVKREKVQVFEVYPGLPGEEPYRRLIEENGRPVPAPALERRDRERQQKVERYARDQARQNEADRQRAAREYEKWLKERTAAIEDIFHVFDVRMLRREPIDGHDTILFALEPRKDARPRTDSGRMMRHFRTLAWISESDYELVRVEVEAVDTVSFGLGLLARLHKGATATYQRRKVDGEAWLPERVTYRGSGRVLLIRRLRLGGVSEFFGYRRFGVETSTTVAPPAGD
jgi:hypothetical protein